MNQRRFWLASLVLLLTPVSSFALQRNYLDTYDYRKIDEGFRALQLKTELRDPEFGDSYFHNETGVEYGASGQYTVGIYAQFVEGLGFSAARMSNRFRITEPNEMPVDMAFQLDIQDANARKAQDRIEGIFIVSKDLEPFNLSANPILQLNREFDANGDDEWEVDLALSLGASFRTNTNATPSLELYIADDQSRLVPGVALDVASNIRLNVGAGIGLDDEADDLQLKTLLALTF